MFLIRKTRKIVAEEFYIAWCRLLTANLTKSDSFVGVVYSFCNWNIFFLLPNNSINCSIWVLELTLLKLTQYYSNICLTTYLSLTNLLMVHSGQYLLFLTTRRERQALFEAHYFSYSLSINQIIWLKQKARVCLNRNLDT